jgi:hypothetical protein
MSESSVLVGSVKIAKCEEGDIFVIKKAIKKTSPIVYGYNL